MSVYDQNEPDTGRNESVTEPELPSVMLYVSPANPFCHQVYDFLVRREVAFTVHDVSEDPAAMRAMAFASGQHDVPVLVVDGQVYTGFDLSLLNRLFPRPGSRGIRLGISVASAKPSEDRPGGAYVGQVKADTPADRAGIRAGDIIIEMAQRPVRRAEDVHTIAAEINPGSRIPLTIWRARRRLRLIVGV
jgi:glutaredoxin